MLMMGIYCEIIQILQTNTPALVHASKDVSLEVNAERTKYTLLSRH
jgi:hypothetical protein